MLQRENYNDLYAFLCVAREQNFTKAATKLGISQSALSRTIKQLESRLGVQLFARTTRRLSLTQAGNQLFQTAGQTFTKLDQELAMLGHYRETPSGLVRITASQYALDKVLLPKLAKFQTRYPDIQLELISDTAFSDIISEQFDAGVRFGDLVAEGMIAVRISNDEEMAVIGSPYYFHAHGFPKTPSDLAHHQCLNYRYASGAMYHWDFVEHGKQIQVKVQGQWTFSNDYSIRDAAKLGLGLGYICKDLVQKELEKGELIQVLSEFSYTFTGFHLYYPHRNTSPALKCVIDALRE
ncbi:LysR family transcriptional regulator [Actinobacillus equuli]|uniref:Transcriptional regulator n=1 Tax=Actinobacillus equuli TaxID=718 RepID=A0AAX3FLU8_ACTEU|nr:LysR family transcriptional regulator [Actinobacillus equuli]AIZ78593.1 LysR family transcriptional regulator [Actinobacillus equuli subsp. equuli]WGE44857.1 LysR family transcriptional regulator [Actinobacillus equuli subsp. equuli]VEE92656.1 putative transcriptional regulator [Actinobacillus equuli]